MVGKDTTYKHIVPVTTLNAFHISPFSMGIIEDSEATSILVEDKSESNAYKKILIRENKIIGAIVISDTKTLQFLKDQ